MISDYIGAINCSKEILSYDSETLYVIDTNFLLGSLQIIDSAPYYLEALQLCQDNLYIPFIVYIEFLLNYRRIISSVEEQIEDYNQLLDEQLLIDLIELDKTFFADYFKQKFVKKAKTNNFQEKLLYRRKIVKSIDSLIEILQIPVSPALDVLNEKYKNTISSTDISSFRIQDDYKEKMAHHLNDLNILFQTPNVVGKEYSKEYFEKMKSEIKERLLIDKIPGTKDKHKEQKNKMKYFGSLEWLPSYGDGILWLDLIDFVKANQDKYNKVVLISDEKKEDWVDKDKKTLKEELVIEFVEKTGLFISKVFSSDFLKKITKVNNDDPIEELFELSQKEDWLVEAERQAQAQEQAHREYLEAYDQEYMEAYIEAQEQAQEQAHREYLEAYDQEYMEAYIENQQAE